MAKLTIEERVLRFLARSDDKVFVRPEFEKFGGYDQVGRVLRGLVKRGVLIKAGYGVYVKAKASTSSGRPVPVVPLMTIGFCALTKLGIENNLGSSAKEYRAGKTTQIPMVSVIDIGNARVVRRIGFGKNIIKYESA